jgi:hypothetical protein
MFPVLKIVIDIRYKVGSTDAMSLATAMAMNNLSGSSQSMLLSPNTTMPIYNAAEASLYTRLAHNSYPQVNTKPIAWTIPYGDDTSPVENYSLEQAASYIPTSNTITSDYGQSYRWSQTQRTPYLEQDTTTGYNSSGVSFIQTSNVRPATTAEPLSPLNLASMSSALPISLPERPYPRRMTTSDVSMPQRQLPMPQPSPAQSTRNTVDLLQDQRLRSAQLYAKPAFPWNVEASDTKSTQSWHDATGSDIQNATASEASSAELMAKASVPVTSVGDLSYMPITAGEDSSSATAQLGQLNFSTSSLLESMAAPASTATYSNFRNHNNSISTSTDALSFLPRQSSQTNLYSYTSDSVAKKHSEGSSNKAALVNGQRYTPLSQHQPHHAASIEGLRQETYKSQHVPLHRASMSNLDRTY